MIQQTIPMQAFGKARPRVTRRGTYMPKEYEAKKHELRLRFGPVPDGLISISVIVIRKMPASWSRAKRAELNGRYASARPDVDNVLGAVMDALITDDDARVVGASCIRFWGDDHSLIVTITQMENDR